MITWIDWFSFHISKRNASVGEPFKELVHHSQKNHYAHTHINTPLDHSRERSSPELSEMNPAEAFGKRASASNKPRLILVIRTFRSIWRFLRILVWTSPNRHRTTGCHHVPEETPRDLCAGINRNMEMFMKLKNNYEWAWICFISLTEA